MKNRTSFFLPLLSPLELIFKRNLPSTKNVKSVAKTLKNSMVEADSQQAKIYSPLNKSALPPKSIFYDLSIKEKQKFLKGHEPEETPIYVDPTDKNPNPMTHHALIGFRDFFHKNKITVTGHITSKSHFQNHQKETVKTDFVAKVSWNPEYALFVSAYKPSAVTNINASDLRINDAANRRWQEIRNGVKTNPQETKNLHGVENKCKSNAYEKYAQDRKVKRAFEQKNVSEKKHFNKTGKNPTHYRKAPRNFDDQ